MMEHLLPFFEERNANIDMLILHCSAYPADKVLGYMEQYKSSCHYLIDETGNIIKVVDEKYSAQHAGIGFWRGSDFSLNRRSIGIELCHPTLGQSPYNSKQIAVLAELGLDIVKRYQIEPVNVVGHSDVAPLRKPDPGPMFPWQNLAEKGLGLWFQPEEKEGSDNITELLAQIGYDTRTKEAVRASAYAFCRHFLPSFVKVGLEPRYLVDNILPDDFSFMKAEKFLQVLQNVAAAYK